MISSVICSVESQMPSSFEPLLNNSRSAPDKGGTRHVNGFTNKNI